MATDGKKASSDDSQGPETRKLRFSEPDLKITVGETDNAIVYWYHSQVMATHSHCIDTMLASPMKESETYEIRFPDIEPDIWDSMMKCVSDPLAIRDMTVEDVMLIATAYDQYDFAAGLQCCDRVLLDYLKKVYETRGEEPSDLDFVIDAFLLADKAHLEEAKKNGIEYFRYVLKSDKNFGRCMFDERRMKRLAQIIAKETLLADALDEWTKEEILSPLFPRLFVSTLSLHLARSQLYSAVPRIKLSGLVDTSVNGVFSFYKNDGEYICDRTMNWGGVHINKMKIRLGQATCDDWVILAYSVEGGDGKIMWKCPFSSNLLIPPKDHWVPVDELATGTPKVEYCSSDKDPPNPYGSFGVGY